MTDPATAVRERAVLLRIDHEKPMAMPDAAGLVRGLTVYVASPYGDSEPRDVRDRRHDAVFHMCGRLISAGVRTYSPIVHTHRIAASGYGPPGGWYDYDLGMVGLFDALVVAMLDGWNESRGVRLEIERMRSLGKPILYVRPDG